MYYSLFLNFLQNCFILFGFSSETSNFSPNDISRFECSSSFGVLTQLFRFINLIIRILDMALLINSLFAPNIPKRANYAVTWRTLMITISKVYKQIFRIGQVNLTENKKNSQNPCRIYQGRLNHNFYTISMRDFITENYRAIYIDIKTIH